jgi:hypothetical protein
MNRFRPPFAIYWRNPKTRTFERIPNASVIGYVTEHHAFPVEISPSKYSKWYTIEPEVIE